MEKRTPMNRPHSWAPIPINCTHASLLNMIGLSESERRSVRAPSLSQITLPFHLALLRVSPRSCSIRKNAKESAPPPARTRLFCRMFLACGAEGAGVQ